MCAERVVIMGAAGRDFHNFNTLFRGRRQYEVVAFTAAQIPNITGRCYPASLAGPGYPEGIPIVPEEELPGLVHREGVDLVVLSYSDLRHESVMHQASIALAAGGSFLLPGPRQTMLRSRLPVISVGAVRTGCGKSPVSRFISRLLAWHGLRVAVVRHPMPYGDLEKQAVQRFSKIGDLARAHCTIEEREEYEPHIREGSVVWAGVDYEEILRRAERESDVILWDGGNNDLPFFAPDLNIVLADPLRAGHEVAYHPGEANFRMADVLIVNKVGSAEPRAIALVERHAAALNPRARLIRGDLKIRARGAERLRGKRVMVVEDGPTVTHGGMDYGAGWLLARSVGARPVDPRRSAAGSLIPVLRAHPRLRRVLPAMGYSLEQVHDLEETIRRSNAEAVVDGSPVDLGRILRVPQPIVPVKYEYEDMGGQLAETVQGFLRRSGLLSREVPSAIPLPAR
ncbi:MAG: GTPase [Euryarchaeota archaeon]|nr:GTPase [Euryarchaeota archaeon]MDE1835376.1 GTPase [Euryarchaeota archaeon]MDE2043672.1 GTPase [Thermoplasmata archaeon]